ncbi:MAG: rod shape-determining protein RodA [Proteobacteria bacterium]|nr:rod shape-determining protein RodA [Pseudomonadota bacterium]
MLRIDRRLIQNFEWPLLVMALLLGGIGIVNLISASPGAEGGVPPIAKRQLLWLGVGGLALLAALVPEYRSFGRLAVPIYAACCLLLLATLLTAPIINGSQRWLILGPVRLQPSELTKLAVILLFSRILVKRRPQSSVGLPDLGLAALIVAVPVLLVLRQPDLGTALITAIVAASYLLVARVGMRLFSGLAAGGIGAAASTWFFYLHDYQKNRVLAFLDPDRDPLGAAYHAIQSRIAVGSGGLFGKGYLQGSQSQLGFLPEQQTDFVFSVLAEEWGFVGALLVLGLYAGILLRGLLIAYASKDAFGSYLAMGVVALLFWSIAINIGMVLGALPVVGVPLPFLSYGGSSLLTCLVAIGLLMNVSMRRYVF